MSPKFANYHQERAAFKRLFAKECLERILLLKGESGSGKTSLLRSCVREGSLAEQSVSIELRSTSVNISEIFSRTAAKIGWENLREFSRCVQELSGKASPQINLSSVTQHGEQNSLRVALTVESLSQREYHQTLLTDAWFADIETIGDSLVMVFDTYEKAPQEVRNWLSGPFLSRAANCALVRVAIAGQEVPDVGIEWDTCHVLHGLYGVAEASEWLPVVTALGKRVPLEPAHTWLAGICHALNGRPSEIMKIIEGLPNLSSGNFLNYPQ
jgi:hypothetical protein